MPPRPLRELLVGLDARRSSGMPPARSPMSPMILVRCMPGGLFVALRGGYADGHRFIARCREARAQWQCSLKKRWMCRPSIRAQVVVPDTRAALAVVAANWYQHPANDLIVIGVTGTNGKTTTTAMID